MKKRNILSDEFENVNIIIINNNSYKSNHFIAELKSIFKRNKYFL